MSGDYDTIDFKEVKKINSYYINSKYKKDFKLKLSNNNKIITLKI